jgi:hypothetical protein
VQRRDRLGNGLFAVLLLAGCGTSVPPAALRSALVVTPDKVAPSHRERYCTATSDEWSVPRCVGELTIEQARRRFRLARLLETNGRVVRIDQINSNLQFAEDTPSVTATELLYDGVRVIELVGLDRNNIVRTRKRLVPSGIRWFDSIGRPLPEGETRVSGAEQALDELGRVVELRYVDATGEPATRADGVSIVLYRYGPVGLAEDESYFARDGSPHINNKGVHRIAHTYRADGLERETRFLDAAGSPAPRADGVQRIVRSFDENGNWIVEELLDAAGNLHEGEDRVAISRVKHDERGRSVELSFFNRNGSPAMSSSGYITRRAIWNEKGLATSWSFFDGAGNPARVHDIYHSIQRRAFDSRDRLIRKEWFNPDGARNMRNGAAVELYFYDDRDNLILRRSLTDTGAPTTAEDGHYSILRQTFDVDRLLRKEYLDETGRLFAIDGSAGIAYVYDSLGTRATLQLDGQGQPMSSEALPTK